MNIIFAAISNLTGGLINDATTLIIGMLSVQFVIMGFGKLKDALEERIEENIQSNSMKRAQEYKDRIKSSLTNVERDTYRMKYKNAIRRAAGR